MEKTGSLKVPIRPDILEALVEHAEHGITIAEREGDDTILLYVNKAFTELTGYSEEECLFKDCRFLQSADKGQESILRIREALDKSEAVEVLLRNYKKDGTLFWNDLSITPYFDAVDGVTYYIGIQKDVTQRVELEMELADVKKQLAQFSGG